MTKKFLTTDGFEIRILLNYVEAQLSIQIHDGPADRHPLAIPATTDKARTLAQMLTHAAQVLEKELK